MPKTSKHVGESNPARPEFFRLPKTGGDPYFRLTRPHYYELEKSGKIKLTRLRKPGTTKGVTLVPFAAVLRMLEAASASGSGATAKKVAKAVVKKGGARQ